MQEAPVWSHSLPKQNKHVFVEKRAGGECTVTLPIFNKTESNVGQQTDQSQLRGQTASGLKKLASFYSNPLSSRQKNDSRVVNTVEEHNLRI